MVNTVGVQRGCGVRTVGGVYSCCPLSPDGLPLEFFLQDPPVPVDMDTAGLTAVGVQLVFDERRDVWDIWDFVGEGFYPNVTDFLEEVRRFGLSRKLPRTLEFSRLTPGSRHVLLHRKGWIKNYKVYGEAEPPHVCPRGTTGIRPLHSSIPWGEGMYEYHHDEPCAGMWWRDVRGGIPSGALDQTGREALVTMPSFQYTAFAPPMGVMSEYLTAVIASFPIHHLEVIRDPDEMTHETGFHAAEQSSLPVILQEA